MDDEQPTAAELSEYVKRSEMEARITQVLDAVQREMEAQGRTYERNLSDVARDVQDASSDAQEATALAEGVEASLRDRLRGFITDDDFRSRAKLVVGDIISGEGDISDRLRGAVGGVIERHTGDDGSSPLGSAAVAALLSALGIGGPVGLGIALGAKLLAPKIKERIIERVGGTNQTGS